MWNVVFTPEAQNDFNKLDGSVKKPVAKAIQKVSANPLPNSQGGYGKPLGNKNGNNLTNLLKIKLRDYGIRIVYKLEEDSKNESMKIIVISVRTDNEVYDIAAKRENK